MTSPFLVHQLPGESWRDTVTRIAARHGLEGECLWEFDRQVANGDSPARAAFDALYDWDCLELVDG